MQEKTIRALARVANGATPYAAALAEKVSFSTVYNAIKKSGIPTKSYAYQIGERVAAIQLHSGIELPQKLLLELAGAPHGSDYWFDLHSLGHLLSGEVELPDEPPGFEPSERATADFWRGFTGFRDRRSAVGDRRGRKRVAEAVKVAPTPEPVANVDVDNTLI